MAVAPRELARPRALPKLLLLLLAAAALLWIGALIRFISDLPRQVAEPGRGADGVVVFTGGPTRIAAGIEVLSTGLANRMLISGVHAGTTKSDIQATTGVSPELLACCVDLGFAAADTSGNAIETAKWAREGGFKSLRVVTASYHMPRSLVELQRRLPDVELLAHPVFPPQFKLAQWWTWPGTAMLLFEEGNKFMAALVRARIDAITGGNLDAWMRGEERAR